MGSQAESDLYDKIRSDLSQFDPRMLVLAKRLWMKVRRRLHTLGLLHLYQNTILEPIDNWLLLTNLANGGMKAFQTEKRLRSAEFHHHQVLCTLSAL